MSDDDVSPRHELRWLVGTFPAPAPADITAQARDAMSRLSPEAAAYERARIGEIAPGWLQALDEGAA